VFAVIETGGKQYKVAVGDTVDVEKLVGKPGDKVELGNVLLVSDEESLKVGQPMVEGAKVVGTIVAQDRARKIVVFKYKPKKRYRRKTGHRQSFTRLTVDQIVG
jgi:large subunit ribosomal protein L21